MTAPTLPAPYEVQDWSNYDPGTPISGPRLDNIELGIKHSVDAAIMAIQAAASALTAASAASAQAATATAAAGTATAVANSAAAATTGTPSIFAITSYGALKTSPDNSTAIIATITAARAAGGGVILFPAGTWLAQGIPIYANLTYRGSGKGSTTVKLVPGANKDLFITDQFATYTGGVTQNGPRLWGLEHMTLDGNGANQATGSTSICCRVYGANYRILHVDMRNGLTGNFWTEWGNGGLSMESTVFDCKFYSNLTGDNVTNHGPHDMKWSMIMVYASGTVVPGRGYVGGNNVVGGTGSSATVINDMHVFGSATIGIELKAPHFMVNCISEGATLNVLFGTASCSWIGGSVFGSNTTGQKGFAISNNVKHTVIRDMLLYNFGTGSTVIDWGYGGAAGGENHVSAQVILGAATLLMGAISNPYDHVEIMVMDAQGSSIMNISEKHTFRAGLNVAGTGTTGMAFTGKMNQALRLSDGTQDKFNFNTNTNSGGHGSFSTVFGADLIGFKDGYLTRTFIIDGLTGGFRPGTPAGLGATIHSGAGAPTIAGELNDVYFRSDAPGGIYFCTVAGIVGVAVWTLGLAAPTP